MVQSISKCISVIDSYINLNEFFLKIVKISRPLLICVGSVGDTIRIYTIDEGRILDMAKLDLTTTKIHIHSERWAEAASDCHKQEQLFEPNCLSLENANNLRTEQDKENKVFCGITLLGCILQVLDNDTKFCVLAKPEWRSSNIDIEDSEIIVRGYTNGHLNHGVFSYNTQLLSITSMDDTVWEIFYGKTQNVS